MISKKLIACVLSLIMAMTLVPSIQYTAFAADEGEISDIELHLSQPAIQITEGTNGVKEDYWDEENQEDRHYFRYNLPKLRPYLQGITVTYTSGSEIEYSWNADRDAFAAEGRADISYADFFNYVGSTQKYEPWQGGGTYAFIVNYEDIEVKIPVTIVKRSIAEISIGLKKSPIDIPEETYENEDGSHVRYTMPTLPKYLTDITIKDTSGSSLVYVWDRANNQFACDNGETINYDEFFEFVSSDQDTNPWEVGEEHAFTVIYQGAKALIPVRIVEDSIAEIKLNLTTTRISMPEFTNGEKAWMIIGGESDGEEREYYRYFFPDLADKLTGLTISYKDGTQKQYAWSKDSREFTCDGETPIGYYEIFDYYTSNQNRVAWKADEAHSFTVLYNEKKIEVPVKISHVYVKKRVEPQIGIAGKTYDKCSKCGKVINTKTLAALKPAKTSVKSLRAGRRSFTASWYKKSYTGYQLRYSRSSSMSSPKTVTVYGSATTSKTVKKLKAHKKYYVQVRTYKTVKGKKVYSSWSTKKSVRTK